MQALNRSLSSFAPFGPTIIRVVIGALFVLHGVDKFSGGISGVEGFFAANGVPAAGFTAGWVYLVAKSASAATAALGFAGYLGAALGVLHLVCALQGPVQSLHDHRYGVGRV